MGLCQLALKSSESEAPTVFHHFSSGSFELTVDFPNQPPKFNCPLKSYTKPHADPHSIHDTQQGLMMLSQTEKSKRKKFCFGDRSRRSKFLLVQHKRGDKEQSLKAARSGLTH